MQTQSNVTNTNAAPGNNIAPVPAANPMQSLVLRKDMLGNKYAFLPETEDREAKTVQMWDGKKGSKPIPVDVRFYKTTLPMENNEDIQEFVKAYSSTFGLKQIHIRKRMIKSGILERDDSGSVAQNDLTAWKEKLKAALIKAVDEM